MWPDNETERDFLNFSGVSDTITEIVVQARGRPISIGVSGACGIGKSSMIKLIQASLAKRPRQEGEREFVFVEFNAWLYWSIPTGGAGGPLLCTGNHSVIAFLTRPGAQALGRCGCSKVGAAARSAEREGGEWGR